MPNLNLGTFELRYEETGVRGEPVLLIHDSWGDHHQCDAIAARLSSTCRVLSYDRRGHGASSSPGGSVALADQVGDLSTLLSIAGGGARHVVGFGVGGTVALQLALVRPDLVRSLHVHEPSLVGILASDSMTTSESAAARALEASVAARLRAGDHRGAAETYVEGVSSEKGAWAGLPPVVQASFVANAPASLLETVDPTTQSMDLARFSGYRDPILVTGGTRSSPIFAAINERVSDAFYGAARHSFDGAGHFPHVTHPDDSARLIGEFAQYAAQRATQ
ncbi:MAG: alpha/beta hydrolase [Thermoplasmata archaeon]|nr:alpha/beta hydrolase [Thermoplasmata archaeon]